MSAIASTTRNGRFSSPDPTASCEPREERAEEVAVEHLIRDDGHFALVVVEVPRPPVLGPETRAELAAEVEEAALAQGVHKIFVTEAQDSKELVLVNALRVALKISA